MSCLMVNTTRLSRLIAIAFIPLIVTFVLKTGSRASLVTALALAAMLFFMAPRKTKMILAVALPVSAVLLSFIIPRETLMRLTLIVADTSSAQVSPGELQNALGSQEARTELQKRAIELALRNPLFGVGALEFEDGVEAMVRAATGRKSGWQGAHNSYLEVAAENGIPAMLLFAATLFYCLKCNYQTYKTCREDPRLASSVAQSMALVLMTIAFSVCVGFSNNAYDPRAGVLVGLSAANFLAIQERKKALAAAAPVKAAAPVLRPELRMNRRPLPSLNQPRFL
jgi:O-antigen ligase